MANSEADEGKFFKGLKLKIMRLIFLGAPGTGKGTQAALVSKKYGIPHISTGNMLRDAVKKGTELGKKAKKYMDAGELVPDSVMIELVKERLVQDDCKNGFILDGFPRTIQQAEVLDSYLEKNLMPITSVVLLDVDTDFVVRRLTSRRLCRKCGRDYNLLTDPPQADGTCKICGGEIYRRDDDSEYTIMNRLQVYQNQTNPLLEYYEKQQKVNRVDGNRTIQEVQTQIAQIISE